MSDVAHQLAQRLFAQVADFLAACDRLRLWVGARPAQGFARDRRPQAPNLPAVAASRNPDQMRAVRRRLQMVFQDPYGSLDPHMSVRALIGEALRLKGMRSRGEVEQRARELMDLVGLPADSISRKPHEFSGGQRQRIASRAR